MGGGGGGGGGDCRTVRYQPRNYYCCDNSWHYKEEDFKGDWNYIHRQTRCINVMSTF